MSFLEFLFWCLLLTALSYVIGWGTALILAVIIGLIRRRTPLFIYR